LPNIARYESKYLLNYEKYLSIKNDLSPYMEKDKYSTQSPTGSYLVRSLYFDTFDYQAYKDKLDGFFGRTKFRLRCYSSEKESLKSISVEIKTKTGNTVEKYTSPVPLEYYDYFMENWHWPEYTTPVLIDFERSVLLRILTPVVIVEYQREGMCDYLGDGVRVTFDHSLKSADCEELFPKNPFFSGHFPEYIVLEVKSREVPPAWLKRIIQRHGLKLVAYSKYVQSIIVSRNDLFSPN